MTSLVTMDTMGPDARPSMSSKACAFSIAALVGDDVVEEPEEDDRSVQEEEEEEDRGPCISPIG